MPEKTLFKIGSEHYKVTWLKQNWEVPRAHIMATAFKQLSDMLMMKFIVSLLNPGRIQAWGQRATRGNLVHEVHLSCHLLFFTLNCGYAALAYLKNPYFKKLCGKKCLKTYISYPP